MPCNTNASYQIASSTTWVLAEITQHSVIADRQACHLRMYCWCYFTCGHCRYKLDVSLPYAVKDTEGRAKFDKVKQQLEVVLPTVPPPRPAVADMNQEASPLVSEVDDTAAAGLPASQLAAAKGGLTPDASTAGDAVQQASRGQSADQADAANEGSSGIEVNQTPDSESPHQGGQQSVTACSTTAELTDNQRRWAELHVQQAATSAAAGGHVGAATTSNGAVAAAEAAAHAQFIPCTTFSEARPGYVFKRGALGQGYYPDSRLAGAQGSAGNQGASEDSNAPGQPSSGTGTVTSSAKAALATLAAAGIPGPIPGGVPADAAVNSQQHMAAASRLKPRITRALAEDLD
jgi:hypothetical protein